MRNSLLEVACSKVATGIGASLLVVLCANPAGAGSAPDSWITTKTKISLVTTSQINSNAVHVDTFDGRVTLHGKVVSQQQKESAESVAKSIDGVKSVRNLLQIVAPANEKATEETDDHVKERVQRSLKDESFLIGSKIGVKSVDKGVVLLSGKAQNFTEYLCAVEATSMVPGVRSVASEVKVSGPARESELSRTAGKSKDAARDGWITMSTKLRLLADAEVPALEINVDTRSGHVTLFGIVPSAVAKEAATVAANKVDSVVSVDNQLEVVPTAKRDRVDAKDDNVERDIKTSFKERPEFKHVDVSVKNGVVRLTGKVASGWQGLKAATLARATPGVRSVDDDLHLL